MRKILLIYALMIKYMKILIKIIIINHRNLDIFHNCQLLANPFNNLSIFN
jgi:hypothetical protein